MWRSGGRVTWKTRKSSQQSSSTVTRTRTSTTRKDTPRYIGPRVFTDLAPMWSRRSCGITSSMWTPTIRTAIRLFTTCWCQKITDTQCKRWVLVFRLTPEICNFRHICISSGIVFVSQSIHVYISQRLVHKVGSGKLGIYKMWYVRKRPVKCPWNGCYKEHSVTRARLRIPCFVTHKGRRPTLNRNNCAPSEKCPEPPEMGGRGKRAPRCFVRLHTKHWALTQPQVDLSWFKWNVLTAKYLLLLKYCYNYFFFSFPMLLQVKHFLYNWHVDKNLSNRERFTALDVTLSFEGGLLYDLMKCKRVLRLKCACKENTSINCDK